VIEGGGVGPVVLGKQLPPALLGDDAGQRYVGRFIADGVTLEAFRLDDPAVLAGFAGGVGFDELPPPPAAATEAVRRGRAGQLVVTSIWIEEPGPRTAAGTGVGSTLAELQAAHGGAEANPVPATWGDDECAVAVPGLARTYFYFETCTAAEIGSRVTRIGMFE
jgi:hypothetical protein